MTKTLTTETIKLWRINAEITLGETDELDPENNAAKAILALTEELLANREAQPVFRIDMDSDFIKHIQKCSEEVAKWPEWKRQGSDATQFTAPPAPAVEEFGARRCCKDKKCNAPIVGYSVDGLCEDCYMQMSKRPAPVVNPEFTGATAVPDGYCIMPLTLTAANGAKGALSGEFKVSRTVRCHECGGEGCDDCAGAGEFEEEITVPWDTIKEIYRAAVDACRAAMLAAAPEGGNG